MGNPIMIGTVTGNLLVFVGLGSCYRILPHPLVQLYMNSGLMGLDDRLAVDWGLHIFIHNCEFIECDIHWLGDCANNNYSFTIIFVDFVVKMDKCCRVGWNYWQAENSDYYLQKFGWIRVFVKIGGSIEGLNCINDENMPLELDDSSI